MAEVLVYVKSWCPFCHRALALLGSKGASPEVVDVEYEADRFPEMVQRAFGRRTVPQIFIDGRHIGGNDDLQALDGLGQLDPLL